MYKEKGSSLIIIILMVILIIFGAAAFFYNKNMKNEESNYESNYDGNSIIGTFLYETNKTKYSFKENGTGSMSSDNFNYEYKYKIEGNTLNIDFVKDEVHDVAYSFELNNGILKLISKEGTVSIGEEYILKKEDK